MGAKATSQGFLTAEELLGGPAVLHPLPRSVLDWVSVIRQGISAAAVDTLTRGVRISRAELATALGISERTLARRKREGLLSSEESAKLVRLARVVQRAEEVFEDLGAAVDWLKSPNAALSGETPLSLLDTEIGAELVMDTLGNFSLSPGNLTEIKS
jgi:putative toxin-antitoxin system antitoxin component (TIGR02293 family)